MQSSEQALDQTAQNHQYDFLLLSLCNSNYEGTNQKNSESMEERSNVFNTSICESATQDLSQSISRASVVENLPGGQSSTKKPEHQRAVDHRISDLDPSTHNRETSEALLLTLSKEDSLELQQDLRSSSGPLVLKQVLSSFLTNEGSTESRAHPQKFL